MNIEEERNAFLIECRSMMGNAYYPTETGFSNGEFCDPNVQRLFAVWLKAAAQRDEVLAREAELRSAYESQNKDYIQSARIAHGAKDYEPSMMMPLANKVDALQQRVAEAENLLREARKHCDWNRHPLPQAIDAFLASPGCADGEKS